MKNIKLILGIIYILIVSIFFKIYLDLNIDDIDGFLSSNQKNTFLINIENTTYLNLVLIFFIFSFVWSFFLGFGTPVIILTAFLFDVVVGTILLSLSRSLGSLSMYILLKKFNLNQIYSYIKKKNVIKKKFFTYIKKHPVMFFSLLRLIPIPSQLPDLIPVIFKVNNLNYFLGKLIGSLVSYLLLVNLTNQLLINLDLKSHLVDQKDVLNFLISIFLVIAVLFVGYNLKKKFIIK